MTGERMSKREMVLRGYTGLILAFVLAPLLIVAVNSINPEAYSIFPPTAVSLRWYFHLFTQAQFGFAFKNSLVVAAATTIVSLVLGTLASLALVRYRFLGRDLLRSFFLSPVVIPKIVLGVSLFILLVRLRIYGNLTSLVLAHSVVCMPYVIAVVSASLISLDRTLEEAAMDLGARPLTIFRKIVMPQISTALIVAGLFAFIISFDQVETSLFLVRPENNTLPIEMFLYMEKWQDPTIAALSTLLILGTFLLVLGVNLFLKGVDLSKFVGGAHHGGSAGVSGADR
jgi:putative spermidine/putrescine transport system permease protein